MNYTWLSKALEHAPRGMLRILDTHDRFAGRRELLESFGLKPEFFHVTEEQERIALQRADIVWAIKPHEAELFRTYCDRTVLTLPHAEPLSLVSAAPSPSGVLRAGIAGGRNNVNATNIGRFLKVAEDYVRRTLLPVEIVIAGSICDLLAQRALPPWVRLLGRVESMDELYAQADVVLAPMEFSTGLKIKVGEALARGKALISHAHAFEGYAPGHPFHECASFEEMMRALHRVVRDPAQVPELKAASLRSLAESSRLFQATLEETGHRAQELPASAVFVVPFEELRPDSLVHDHVRDASEYVGFKAPIAFFLFGNPTAADPACLAWLAERGRVLCDASLAGHLGPLVQDVFGETRERYATIAEVLAQEHTLAWFAGLPSDLGAAERVRARLGIAHLAVLAQTVRRPDLAERLSALACGFPRFKLLEEGSSALGSAVMRAAGARRMALPVLWRGQHSALLQALRAAKPGRPAVVAPCAEDPDLLPLLAFLTNALGRSVDLYLDEAPAGPPPSGIGPLQVPRDRVILRPLADLLRPATHREGRPAFVLELGHGLRTAPLSEVLLRAEVPHVRLRDPLAPAEADLSCAGRGRARGFVSAALLAATLQAQGEAAGAGVRRLAEARFARDAGWARIWGELSRLVA